MKEKLAINIKFKENNDKEIFIDLLKLTKRKGVNELINWLETSTDFFTAPASTKYHLNEEGGLLKHSLNVCYELFSEMQPKDVLDGFVVSDEGVDKIIIVSLLHDICKANYYTVKTKNVKNKDGKWVKEPYYTVDDQFPVGHGEKSVILIQKFIKLTDEEIMAIRWHMGGFEPKDNYQYISNAFGKCKLALQLHIADLKATYLDEVE